MISTLYVEDEAPSLMAVSTPVAVTVVVTVISVDAKITNGLKEKLLALEFPVAVTLVVCEVTVMESFLYFRKGYHVISFCSMAT